MITLFSSHPNPPNDCGRFYFAYYSVTKTFRPHPLQPPSHPITPLTTPSPPVTRIILSTPHPPRSTHPLARQRSPHRLCPPPPSADASTSSSPTMPRAAPDAAMSRWCASPVTSPNPSPCARWTPRPVLYQPGMPSSPLPLVHLLLLAAPSASTTATSLQASHSFTGR